MEGKRPITMPFRHGAKVQKALASARGDCDHSPLEDCRTIVIAGVPVAPGKAVQSGYPAARRPE
jgi:hypothetical protein